MPDDNTNSTSPMANDCRADPNDSAACAIDGCIYADPTGNLARDGLNQLRTFLLATSVRSDIEGCGCGCHRCTGLDRPLSAECVETVLTHVSPRVATLYALGKVDVRGGECGTCGRVVAAFVDSASSTPGAFARRRCPYHDHLLRSV